MSDHRKDKGTVYITIDGPKDRNGDTPFTVDWWDEGFHLGPKWRGQCFRTNLEQYKQRNWLKSRKLKILDKSRE